MTFVLILQNESAGMPRGKPASLPSLPFTPLRGEGSATRGLPLGVADTASLPLVGGRAAGSNGRRPEKEAGLRESLSSVYRDLEQANREVEESTPIAGHHAMLFSRADIALREALALRDEEGEPRRRIFGYYDNRLTAGHAWNPHRQRLKDAMRWRTALMDEAKAINKELGI